MSFTLIPAIDVAQGHLAVFDAAGPRALDAHGGDPFVAAGALTGAGARWLHVVDLDRAVSGVAANLDVLTRLHVDHPDVRIQASGGIVTLEDARAAIASGAARVVLGSAILGDPTAARRLLRDLGPAAIVGIEVEDGRIRGRGIGRVDLELDPTIEWLGAIGAPGLLVTAVTRVGGLGGPDLATLARVIRPEFPTLAAGGIASLGDLRAVRDVGAAGAVVGRAAVEGELDLAAALAWAAR